MQRLYVPDPLAAGAEITPSEAQGHYLANVMRLAPGDAVALFNGADGEWTARIAGLRRGRATLAVEVQTRRQPAPGDLVLVFAPVKRDATDLLVRQATELGVSALMPVLTTRTNTARLNPERLAAITREAAEQCERLDLPVLHPVTTLPQLLATWPADRRLAVAIERSAPTPAAGAAPPRALLTGPEGGFTQGELDALGSTGFVCPLHLGPLILRAETAVVVGLALLQAPGWTTSPLAGISLVDQLSATETATRHP